MVTADKKAQILIVDDDAQILSFLRKGLIFEGYAVDTASDGAESLCKFREHEPDLAVLDILMPGIDGMEVSRRIREVSDVPILMLTAKGTVADRVAGLDAGADDYLVKPFALDELLARIRALLRRKQEVKPDILQFSDITLDNSTREVRRSGDLIPLTAQEFDFLHYLMRHPRQVLKRNQIYSEIWGYDFEGDSNVLEVYILYLRNKLEAGGRGRVIHTVRGVGYVLKE